MRKSNYSTWTWVPSLYYAEGLPYAFVMIVSVVMYKNMGFSNTDIALYTSWLYLPWVIKPLWSPIVEIFHTKRYWIITMQLLIGAGLAGVALTIPTSDAFRYTLAFFWLIAFSSATHDIAADGFYMLGLSSNNQAWFIGIRNTFYRFAILTGQGLLVILAGQLEDWTGKTTTAWSMIFGILAVLFIVFSFYHKWKLPYPNSDKRHLDPNLKETIQNFFQVFLSYFKKPQIILVIIFILLYRFGEAQLVKIAPLFMLDAIETGGLGLSTSQYGFIYGTLGMIMLTLGGITGGFFAAKHGLKSWIIWMALAMKLPDLVYVYMAYAQPDNYYLISTFVAIEQFGYGFGFTAYLLFMMMISEGEHKTAHYAICTGFMALGMMLPGMFSGALQESIGYQHFFNWVMVATIPGLIMIKFIKIDPQYGMKDEKEYIQPKMTTGYYQRLGIASLVLLLISLLLPYWSLGEIDVTLLELAKIPSAGADLFGVLLLVIGGVLIISKSDKTISLVLAIIGGAFPCYTFYKITVVGDEIIDLLQGTLGLSQKVLDLIGGAPTPSFGTGGYLLIAAMIIQIVAYFHFKDNS
jgi:PAT family beta-lactamase induction signal transducer AmpG